MYKVLSKITTLRKQDEEYVHSYDAPIGVDLYTLSTFIPELSCEADDLVEWFFVVANESRTGFLNWPEFLETMKILTTKNLNIKLGMFFQVIDWDGNGMFDCEEINEICWLSFAK